MLTDEEIDEKIIDAVVKHYREAYDDLDSIYRRIKQSSDDFYASNENTLKRLEHIENLIHSHSVGVQNVYEEIKRLKTMYDITTTDSELLDKLQRIKDILKE